MFNNLPDFCTSDTVSDHETQRLNTDAGHCCPNCDGPLSVGEHEAAGFCSTCYYAGWRTTTVVSYQRGGV